MGQRSEIIRADMTQCEPASAISTTQAKGLWYAVDYQSEDGVKGMMVYSDSREEPPVLTLPLNVTGWHRIYIGVNYTRSHLKDRQHLLEWTAWGPLRVKLTDDAGYCRIAPEALWRKAQGHYPEKFGKEKHVWHSIYEVYWQSADLTDQSLTFATPPLGPDDEACISNISWVRLVPMTVEEIANHRSDLPRPESKRLAGCYCLGQLTGHTEGTEMYHPTDATYVKDMIEPFRDSDFKLLLWEAIRGDICAFNTRIGRCGWIGEKWNPDWVDPMRVGVDYAHDCGLELYVSMRMIGPIFPFKQSAMQQNEYYYRNRQYALRDKDGHPSSILSLAYPHIREHWVSLLREAVAYGADGVHLCLHRANPFVLYEEPVVEPFKAKYGIEPLTLDFDDERWLRHRASFVTDFMREIRTMLDEQGRKMGKRLGIAATFWRNPFPLHYALDIETWIKEGLIDYLMPHWVHMATDDGPAVVKQFSEYTKGTDVKVYPDIMPRTPPGEEYAEKLKAMYDAGADGFSFWTVELRTPRASEWAVIKRLGHYDALDRYHHLAPEFWRVVPLRTLEGISMDTSVSHTDG